MSRKYTVLKLYGGRRKTEETIPAAQEKTCAETPPRHGLNSTNHDQIQPKWIGQVKTSMRPVRYLDLTEPNLTKHNLVIF